MTGPLANPAQGTHRIKWWVYVGTPPKTWRIPRESSMRGTWDYDASCSCGWDSKTGGALERYVRGRVAEHKADVANQEAAIGK